MLHGEVGTPQLARTVLHDVFIMFTILLLPYGSDAHPLGRLQGSELSMISLF